MSRACRPHRGEPVELTVLRGWLRAAKGHLFFRTLARRAQSDGRPEHKISECTLRQALDGRLPTLHTTLAFARGAGADQEKARQLWEAARLAVHPPRRRPAPHVPGPFSTPAGLVRAMNRVRATAPHTSLRALAERSGLSRSTLHRILAGRQMPTAGQVAAFAAACEAGEAATAALLAGHRRILNGPSPASWYPCAVAERADERRQRDEAARPWRTPHTPELGWDDQQRADEEEAAFQRRLADAEAGLYRAPAEQHPTGDLRTELAAIARRARIT